MTSDVPSDPIRYHVTFRTLDLAPRECVHSVVTFMGVPKAVAMATLNHHFVHPDLEFYEVAVSEGMPLEFERPGPYVLNDEDVTDRLEW